MFSRGKGICPGHPLLPVQGVEGFQGGRVQGEKALSWQRQGGRVQ
jgi:hypothetical protein